MGEGALPTGTVTLLLLDVEDSTPLWQDEPGVMAQAMHDFTATFEAMVKRLGGACPVEQGEGDSRLAVFPRASSALACAVELQLSLRDAPLKIRIGMHSGEVDVRDGRYGGTTIIRAARIRNLGHGGQTLLSATTRDLVQDALPEGVEFVDLGAHRLKGLDRRERVTQLSHPDLPTRFPPLVSEAGAGSLPIQLTTFVGRVEEVADVKRLIRMNRLVTLTGAGGCGKTRLSIEACAQLTDVFDAVWFCDFAPLSDPGEVARALRETLGLREAISRSDVEVVVDYLADRDAVVVFDNCEHLVAALAELAEALIRHTANVHVVATSREPLGVAGEVSWRVPSLPEPDAYELFVERAARALGEYVPSTADGAAVREICARLDGIPLAIELAAARLGVLSPQEIVAGLNDRFRLLGRGSRTGSARQQTLLASVGWSYDLLPDNERRALERLSVFVGAFDFEAARDVIADGAEITKPDALDLIAALVARSLLTTDATGGTTTYRMLETVRQYARDRLVDHGDADAAAFRHLRHYAALLPRLLRQQATGELSTSATAGRIEEVYDNLRVAVDWSIAAGEVVHGLLLIVVLAQGVGSRATPARDREIVRWVTECLAQGRDIPPSLHAAGLLAMCWALRVEDVEAAIGYGADALAIATEVGDKRTEALARGLYSSVLGRVDRLRAVEVATEGERVAREVGDGFAVVVNAGTRATALGACDADAVHSFVDAAEAFNFILALAYQVLAIHLSIRGELDASDAAFARSLEELDRTGDVLGATALRASLFMNRVFRGDADEGRRMFDDGRAELDALAAFEDLRVFAGDDIHFGLNWNVAFLAMTGSTDDAVAVDARYRFRLDKARGQVPAAYLAYLDSCMAVVLVQRGEPARARMALADLTDRLGPGAMPLTRLTPLYMAAMAFRALGDLAAAERVVAEALSRLREYGLYLFARELLETAAGLRHLGGNDIDAARLFGAAHAFGASKGIGRLRNVLYDLGDDLTAARAAVGPAEFAAAFAEGEAMSVDDAVAYALRGRGPRQRPDTGWEAVTPTEEQVVALVVEGLTNKAIADRLLMSPRTVSTHLSHIFGKLGVSSRTELAVAARSRGAN